MKISTFIFAIALLLFPGSARAQEMSSGEYFAQDFARFQRVPQPKGRIAKRSAWLAKAPETSFVYGRSDVASQAMRYLGTNPTGWSRAWCAVFVDLVLRQTGHRGLPSARAIDAARVGTRVAGPRPGALAVERNHVSIVRSVDSAGIHAVSGNYSRRVSAHMVDPRRVVAWVMP